MAQGFVRSNNLSESVTPTSDRNILDNLGGVNITQDVLLFDGNSGFKSTLTNDSSISRADFFVFDDTTENLFKTVKTDLINNKRAFSNGTKLSIDNGLDGYPFLVVDSNGVDEFRIVLATATLPYQASDYANIWSTIGDISDTILTRQDTISVDNIINMSRPRLTVIDVLADEEEPAGSGDSGDDGDETGGTAGIGADDGAAPDVGFYDNYGTYDQIGYIAGAIGRLEAKKSRTILTDRSNFFDERLRFKGNIRITNDKLVGNNNTPVAIYNNGDNAPGLFIYNTATGGEIRAFSGSENPWEEVSNVAFESGSTSAALQTESNKSQIANLVFQPDGDSAGGASTGSAAARGYKPKLFKKDGSGNTTQAVIPINGGASGQLTLGSYTHKVPMFINGEQYFMLVKETT
jgi:hypothetical protein